MPKSERAKLIRGTTTHYTRTEELIGRGGYAEVYGCDVKVRAIDRPGLVIKVFRTQYQQKRLGEPDSKVPEQRAYSQTQIREAMAMKRLRGHPNVMQMHHGFICGEDAENAILMDRMDGSVDSLKNLNHGTQKDILRQILCGLDHIHKRGYIHRDMKPDNVLFKLRNGRYSIKISDFGLARLVDDVMTPRMMTVNYRAPEAHGKHGRYTKAIDIWGAAMIACELYVSRRINIFVREDQDLTRGLGDIDVYIESIFQQVGADCPKDLQLLLRSMLHKDPEQRPCIDDLMKSNWLKPHTV
jgi:serine/threonine protein kinase